MLETTISKAKMSNETKDAIAHNSKTKTLANSKAGNFQILKLAINNINRPINNNQVKILMDSIVKTGCVTREVLVFEMTEDIHPNLDLGYHYIIDGQHLFEALRRLGMDIPYKVIPVTNMSDVINIMSRLNTTSNSWIDINYIEAWAFGDNNENYRSLHAAIKKNESYKLKQPEKHLNLPNVMIGAIMMKNTINSYKSDSDYKKRMKEGSFKIFADNKLIPLKTIEYVNDISNSLHNHDEQIGNMVGKSEILGTIKAEYVKAKYARFPDNSGYNHQRFMETLNKILPRLVTNKCDADEINHIMLQILDGDFSDVLIKEFNNRI